MGYVTKENRQKTTHKGNQLQNSSKRFRSYYHTERKPYCLCTIIFIFFYSPVAPAVMHDIVLIYYRLQEAQYSVIYIFFCF